VLAGILGLVVVTILSTTAVAAGVFAYLYTHTQLPEADRLPRTTDLLDRDGGRLASLHKEIDRRPVTLDEIPRRLQQAVLATEDVRFFDHPGVDLAAIARAVRANMHAGAMVEGASTITQQYVKNSYTGADRTFGRKIHEAILALKLEQELTKEEILEAYLNDVYFGHGAYGVEAAARTYFGVHARDLTLLQSATLAAAIAGPSRWDPILRSEGAWLRRNYVIERMSAEGFLDPERVERLQRRPLRVSPEAPVTGSSAYFVDYAKRFLEDRYGRHAVFRGGLRVRTSLDSQWQRAAEQAVRAHLHGPDDPEAALVAIDPATGAVRAMVGGRDFREVQFNLATQARRQTGSAFKPFVLIAALERGIPIGSMWTGPSSTTFDDERCRTDGEAWDVRNYEGSASGTMSLESATVASVNTIYARLTLEVGPERVAEVAQRMGLGGIAPVCSIGLGTNGVSPLKLTAAYAALASEGVYRAPSPVEIVKDHQGGVVDEPLDLQGRRVLVVDEANTVTRVLRGAVERGTGRAAALPDRPVAGKTGTAEEYTDAWFCGYVPQLATCVWVGHREGAIPMRDVNGHSSVYGGSIPAMIWRDFMAAATADLPIQPFDEPAELFGGQWSPPPAPAPEPAPTPEPTPTPQPEPALTPSPEPPPPATPLEPTAPPGSPTRPPDGEPPPEAAADGERARLPDPPPG
jgi:penicillin-binding protein 1A